MFITESTEGKKPDCIMFGYDYIRYSETCIEWYYSFYVFIKRMQISSCFDYMWDFFFFLIYKNDISFVVSYLSFQSTIQEKITG